MSRPQYSLRSALLVTAMIAVALALLRLVPQKWLPPLFAMSCLAVGYVCLLLGTMRDNKMLLLIIAVLTGAVGIFVAAVCVQAY